MEKFDHIPVFETNAALGYREISHFIKVDNIQFLCINSNNNTYLVGSLYSDFDSLDMESSNFNLSDSPLYNDFFFQFFIKHNKF